MQWNRPLSSWTISHDLIVTGSLMPTWSRIPLTVPDLNPSISRGTSCRSPSPDTLSFRQLNGISAMPSLRRGPLFLSHTPHTYWEHERAVLGCHGSHTRYCDFSFDNEFVVVVFVRFSFDEIRSFRLIIDVLCWNCVAHDNELLFIKHMCMASLTDAYNVTYYHLTW